MNRNDWYFGRIVGPDDLDNAFEDAQDAERALAQETGAAQSSTPADTVKYGGIVSGLVVTKASATSVSISAGVARDSQGRRINIPASTVSLAKLGDTDEGDDGSSGAAEGNGSAVAVTVGNEQWLTLFGVYDEHESDPNTDDLGNSVDFEIDESFHFNLAVGTEAVAPATSRAALAADKVLLADILLDDGEDIRVISATDAICGSNAELDAIGYGPGDAAALTGRRGDNLAIEDTTDHPLLAGAVGSGASSLYAGIRAGTSREALYELARLLQVTAPTGGDPAGAELIGVRANASGGSWYPNNAASLAISAGDLQTVLEAVQLALNGKMGRGGDLVRPAAGQNGIQIDPQNMVGSSAAAQKTPFSLNQMVGGTLLPWLYVKPVGPPALPTFVYDDFVYGGSAGSVLFGALEPHSKWGINYVVGNGGTVTAVSSERGGVIALTTTGAADGDGIGLLTGNRSATAGSPDPTPLFNAGAAPWAMCSVRFSIPTALSNAGFRCGFNEVGGNSWAYLGFNPTDGIFIEIIDTTGTVTAKTTLLAVGSCAADTWYTARLIVNGDDLIAATVAGGAAGQGVLSSAQLASSNLASAGYAGQLLGFNTGAAVAKTIYVDSVSFSAGSLNADEI